MSVEQETIDTLRNIVQTQKERIALDSELIEAQTRIIAELEALKAIDAGVIGNLQAQLAIWRSR